MRRGAPQACKAGMAWHTTLSYTHRDNGHLGQNEKKKLLPFSATLAKIKTPHSGISKAKQWGLEARHRRLGHHASPEEGHVANLLGL